MGFLFIFITLHYRLTRRIFFRLYIFNVLIEHIDSGRSRIVIIRAGFVTRGKLHFVRFPGDVHNLDSFSRKRLRG